MLGMFKADTVVYCTLQPGRDVNGAAIALFTARLHYPSQTSHQAVLNALIFQLDVAMERSVLISLQFSFEISLTSLIKLHLWLKGILVKKSISYLLFQEHFRIIGYNRY